MTHPTQLFGIVAAALYAVGFVTSAQGAGCDVTASFSSPSPEVDYDPFRPATQRSNQFSLSLTVPAPQAGQPRVRTIDYQFLDTNSSAQPQIGSVGALVDIVRGPRNLLRASTVGDFSDPDTYNTLTLPNNVFNGSSVVGVLAVDGRQDLAAGRQSENFDLAYRCNFSDGTTGDGVIPAALLSAVDTQYLVRATVVGGGSAKTLTIDPLTRGTSGGMAIRSTGPYSFTIESDNALKMLPVGTVAGSVLPLDQVIPYQVRIDNQPVTLTSLPKLCARSGLAGAVVRLSTSLGSGVNTNIIRAGDYSDILTVTITPEMNGGAGAASCGS
jgi:hypothetical protein